ncbi:MAG: hypothetical protein IPI49_33685 [Myxococcales bacterium]|nr:hypothetical protein [Myxococcales bacterium]
MAAGVDVFDCVMPTRGARIRQPVHLAGPRGWSSPTLSTSWTAGPLDPVCVVRHLHHGVARVPAPPAQRQEILYARLATLHNLTFYLRWIRRLRERILQHGRPA